MGQMGCGIAQVAAQVAKIPVILLDADSEKLNKSLKFMGASRWRNGAGGCPGRSVG